MTTLAKPKRAKAGPVDYNLALAQSTYNEDDKAALRWLLGYIASTDTSMTQMAKELGTSVSPLQKVLKGTYEASPETLIKTIKGFRDLQIERKKASPGIGYVKTELGDIIWRACDRARIFQWLVPIVGESQIGKSINLKEYAKAHSENTIYFDVDNVPTKQQTARRLCMAAGLKRPWGTEEAWEMLTEKLNGNWLVIADEAHMAIEAGRKGVLNVIEWLRKLHDATGCGLVLAVTPTFTQEVQKGACKELLTQVARRGEMEILPNEPSWQDMRKIYTAYGLPDPDEQTREIVETLGEFHGFGKYTDRLVKANYDAVNAGEIITWARFVEAHKFLESRGN